MIMSSNYVSKVIKVASGEVGYVEKKSNAFLNSKKINAGYNNWTKYNKYFGFGNVYWCANGYCWFFAKAYGKEEGKKVLYGIYSASCEFLRQNFIKHKAYDKKPRKGDAIFFEGSRHSGANHIELVTKVSNGRVYTIGCNTSSGNGMDDNGGGVYEKSYSLTYDKILGYGHPLFTVEKTTLSAPKPILKKGNSGSGVKVLQKCLNKILNSKLEIDGEFGEKTKNAVISFQKKFVKNSKNDGIYDSITYKAMKSKIK